MKDLRVVIFSINDSSSVSLQEKVNEWLKANPTISVEQITQSSYGIQVLAGSPERTTVISIWYTEPKPKE